MCVCVSVSEIMRQSDRDRQTDKEENREALSGMPTALGAGLESREPKTHLCGCCHCAVPISLSTHCLSSWWQAWAQRCPKCTSHDTFLTCLHHLLRLSSRCSVWPTLCPGPQEHAFLSPDWSRDGPVRSGPKGCLERREETFIWKEVSREQTAGASWHQPPLCSPGELAWQGGRVRAQRSPQPPRAAARPHCPQENTRPRFWIAAFS